MDELRDWPVVGFFIPEYRYGDPMLPAVITLFYAAIQLGLVIVGGGLEILPPGLRVTVGIGGPACLALIAAAELWLHVEDGASIRSLP